MTWTREQKQETHQTLREQHTDFLGFMKRVERVAEAMRVSEQVSQASKRLSQSDPNKPSFVAKVDRWGSIPFDDTSLGRAMQALHETFSKNLGTRDPQFAERHAVSAKKMPSMATPGFAPNRGERA